MATISEGFFPEKSTRVITVRLTRSEHRLLREAAQVSQLSMNRLVRQSALRGARAVLLAARRGGSPATATTSEVPS